MRRPGRLLGAACAVLLTVTSSGLTAAQVSARPNTRVAERRLPNGAVIASVRTGEVAVSFIGHPGSGFSVSAGGSSASAAIQTTRPKTARDANAYADAGRSVIDDLVALGMPAAEAQRQFGDLATLDGTEALVSRQLVKVRDPRPAAPAAAGSTPYDTQCASINVAEGKITGYGCSTFFLVHQDGNDWWLTTKMKVSAHSNDESWFSPKRLTQLGWRASWSTGNVLYDWDPYTTREIGSCLTLTVKSSSPWADVSVQGTVCPDSLGPWSVTTARSGGIWNGMERGTDYEGALATQAVHSPPGAAVSYQSAWTLSYCDLWCN
jgi:hypothetical protein